MAPKPIEQLLHVAFMRPPGAAGLFDLRIALDEADLREKVESPTSKPITTTSETPTNPAFKDIISTFRNSLAGYRRAATIFPLLGTVMGSRIIEEKIKPKVSKLGMKLENIGTAEYYTVPVQFFDQLRTDMDEMRDYNEFGDVLPRLFVIGLVSSYDGYLGNLIDKVFECRSEILNNSDGKLTLQQILQFETIEDAKTFVKSREVDVLLRESRTEQINWLAKKLNTRIDMADPIWKEFVEICERRNLFTHTGGRVTRQYIENCKKADVDLSGIAIGSALACRSKIFDPLDRRIL